MVTIELDYKVDLDLSNDLSSELNVDLLSLFWLNYSILEINFENSHSL